MNKGDQWQGPRHLQLVTPSAITSPHYTITPLHQATPGYTFTPKLHQLTRNKHYSQNSGIWLKQNTWRDYTRNWCKPCRTRQHHFVRARLQQKTEQTSGIMVSPPTVKLRSNSMSLFTWDIQLVHLNDWSYEAESAKLAPIVRDRCVCSSCALAYHIY